MDIAWYTVGVINISAFVDEKNRIIADDIGTGTACDWHGRKMILTAKHVLKNAQPKDLQFLLRVGNAIDWDADPRKGGVTSRVSLPVDKIIRCKGEDLAMILLKPDGLEAFNVRFCELAKRLARTKATNNQGALILLGYPSDQIFDVSESRTGNITTKSVACVPTVLTGHIAIGENYNLSSSYDPENHVLIRFEPVSSGPETTWLQRCRRLV